MTDVSNYKKMDDNQHILARPAMYIGSVDLTKTNEFFLDDDKITYQEREYVPGLIKIINEIIDNSVDVATKNNFQFGNNIEVTVANDCVTVKDNGTGIPIIKNEDGHYIPELCWNHARAGSNFNNDEDRTQIGMNGIGSFATACFSKEFIGKTDDGKKSYTIKIKNNASSFTETVGTTKTQGTIVQFYPDLGRFGLDSIDETHKNVIKQRLINLSMTFPEITFKFNKRKINVSSFKKYVSMFSSDSEIYESDNYRFAIIPNNDDDFRQFSYVNGLKIPDGGTHIDIITSNIVSRIRDKLVKKYKTIKPGDIKNKLMVISFMKDVKNPKFNSQAKEKITNSVPEINKYFGEISYDAITAKILKNAVIMDPIVEVYKIKEELKRRQELKGLEKAPKKIKSDKYLPPISNKKFLLLVEGDCLDEDTDILMGDYSVKKLKDVDIGDTIISGDLSQQVVQAKTKLLKETITIKTKTDTIICGKEHRLKVYDTNSQTFEFVNAVEIKNNPDRYKLVKSKVNNQTVGLKVEDNDTAKHVLKLDDGYISYTDDDFFVVLRYNVPTKVHSLEIIPGDIILMS